MRQLSPHDAAFLYSETAHANSNVTLIQIYDQSTAPGGKVRFKSILAHIEGRLGRSPVFRQKLLRVPLELDYPYWVDDENFDLEYHVRHIALPKPGDWRQFCIQASRIHARPLDLNRPLWELYVIEGLDSFLDLPEGSFALLTKIHHAAIDIEHGSEITALLHDTVARPEAPSPIEPWFAASPPGALELLMRGAMGTVFSPLRFIRPLVASLAQLAPAALDAAGGALFGQHRSPTTRFNSAVSPHRVFDTRRFMLDEFKAIRRLVPTATLNDAVLAVCAGGLRRYLDENGELPDESLTAIAPVVTRGRQAGSPDKPEMTLVRVALGTHLADPVTRLAFIRDQAKSSVEMHDVMGVRELTDLVPYAPAASLALSSKMQALANQGLGRRAPLANCTITNVPGPEQPLYLLGAHMTYFSAIMPITDGMGLVLAVTSYDGRIIVSPTACRELVPDPQAFTQCIRDSFQEYLALAQAVEVSSRTPAASASGKAPRKRPTARKASTAPRAATGARTRARAPLH